MNDLAGKIALVTGSGRGIGRAIAVALAKRGADIAVHYVGRPQTAQATQEEITALGVRCITIRADLKNPECAQVIGEALKGFGGVDILVLNASVQIRRAWNDISPEEFDEQMHCNVLSSLLLIQKFAPAMQERHWGRIITIGSVQERKPHPEMLVYSASKAAQSLMAQSLALRLAEFGVTVNNVAPGVILTDRNAQALEDPQYYEKILAGIPLGICGQPQDCAGAVTMLCGEEGRYITGQNLFVDGGMGIC